MKKEPVEKTNEIQGLIANIGNLISKSSLNNLEVIGLLEVLKQEVGGKR